MISIVTPALNAAGCIRRNLESLARQEAEFEHLVQDGGSTDGTPDIARSYVGQYPVSVVVEKDAGMYDAILRAMRRTRGEILAWLNADDFYLPWTLRTVEEVFRQHPEVDWITGLPAWYFEDTRLQETAPFAPCYQRAWIRRGWHRGGQLGFLQQESMFWRRRLWERAGPEQAFQGRRLAGDYHLWRHMAQHAELRTVGTVLACFSISPQQASARQRDTYLREAGAGSKSQPAAWGSLLNRLTATLFFRHVITPRSLRSRSPGNLPA